MAEAIVSVVLQQIATILSDRAMKEMRMFRDLKEHVKNLETYLIVIRSALEDAEQIQMVDGPIILCLEDLKIVSYDIEDVLKTWKWKKVKSPFFSRKITGRIKNIREKLSAFEMKNKFSLGNSKIISPRNKESTCYGGLLKVIGRDHIKNKIVSDLIDEKEQGTCTISIVGMGGIGKTALAQLIYHDPRLIYKDGEEQQRFDKKIWVYVSNNFDTIKIAQAIILAFMEDNQSDNLAFAKYIQPSVTLQYLLKGITETIQKVTFFLILDDVWADNGNEGWEQLQTVLKQGKAGSKILVTTRKVSVAKRMSSDSDLIYHLSNLSDSDCWSILDQFAFDGKDQLSEVERENLIKISMESKGLPLVAKALGNFLQERSPAQREYIRYRKLSEFKNVWELVMSSLLLSYLDLPSKIKQCFLYCAIFPKGFRIQPDNLIRHWMAQDYLTSGTNVDMEDTGIEFFGHLVSGCLFQDFEKEGDAVIVACKMHDIIYDLVQYLTRRDFVTIDLNEFASSRTPLGWEDARHLTIIIHNSAINESMLRDRLKLCSTHKLRSLVTFSTIRNGVEIADALLPLFKTVQLLMVLKLNWNGLWPKNLFNVGHLKYLRHLNLFHCEKIQELPSIVCKLHDLLSLDLHRCRGLKSLPDGIGDLINLRFLRTTDCSSLSSYPKGIGRLTSLRTLTDIIARADCSNSKELCLGDLENLNNLCGNLRLKLMGNAIDVQEADKAKLQNKMRLREIKIYLVGGIDLAAATTALDPHPSTTVRFLNHSEW